MIEVIIICVTFLIALFAYLNKRYPKEVDINAAVLGEIASIKSELLSLRDTLSDYQKMKEDLKDIQAKSNSIQIGKAFMPSRRS